MIEKTLVTLALVAGGVAMVRAWRMREQPSRAAIKSPLLFRFFQKCAIPGMVQLAGIALIVWGAPADYGGAWPGWKMALGLAGLALLVAGGVLYFTVFRFGRPRAALPPASRLPEGA